MNSAILRSKFFKYKRFLDKPIVLLTIIFLGIFIFSLLLYFEINRSSSEGSNEIIGQVSFVSNSVKKKGSQNVVWNTVNYQTPLSRRDLVRTDPNSMTMLALSDGTELRLDENSMVLVDIQDKTQKLELQKGNIHLNKKNTDTILEIRSGDLRVDIKKVGEYNLKINKNGTVEISVNSGEALVNKNSIAYEIKEAFLGFFRTEKKENSSQQNEATANNPPDQKKQESNIDINPIVIQSYSILSHPENLKFFLTKNDTLDIPLSWSSKDEVNKIQISIQNDFSSVYKESITKDKKISFNFPVGSYFWRVISINPNSKFETESRKFIVLKDVDFNLRFPDKDSVFRLREKSILINFAWDNLSDIQKYTLQVSRNIGFEKIDYSLESESNILSIELSNIGDYYYRVKAIQKNPDFPERFTNIGKFKIENEENEIKLELLNPPKSQKLDPTNKVLFGWGDNKSFQKYTLLISEDANFSSNVKKIQTQNNYAIQENLKKESVFFWKVEGILSDGKSVSSETRSFHTKMVLVETITPPKPAETAKMEPEKNETKVTPPAKTSPKLNVPKSKVNSEVKYEEDN